MMFRRPLRVSILAVFVLAACVIPGPAGQPVVIPFLSNPGGQPEAPSVVISADPNATPTPFLPIDPTARALTPTPSPTPAWGGFPGPSVPPNVPIPPPVAPIEQPDGQITILLYGSDQRANPGGFRTDTIVLLTLNRELDAVSLTSFPRDLYVYIPGWTMQRINTAHPHGGFAAMQDTFAYNFGFKPDFYVLINFWNFVQVIDNLGGINVNVAVSLTDHRDGQGSYTVPAGLVHMDGETALWYVRSRYTSSDFERTRRQQEVLLAIFFRIVSLNGLQRAPELYNLYVNNVVTNAGFNDLAPFLGLAGQVTDNSATISRYTIDRSQVTSYTTSAGAAVLLPDYAAIRETLRKALNVP
ncbi:MAG TPA: LCP family protein [Anaerolineales bacterium]|nr:LCP family protein [Anaerolineales bacterium]